MSDVKVSRINTLTHEYELFKMNQNETIQDMQKRFTHIVNRLALLGKTIPNEDLTKNFNPKKNLKKSEKSSPNPRCYECNQLGHMKMKCPTYKNKMEKLEKKSLKEKKAYITWEENAMDSSSDSENEVANLSLMARDCESDEKVTSSNLNSSISFDELPYAFNDFHKESIKLAKFISSNKKVVPNLEKEISKFNKE